MNITLNFKDSRLAMTRNPQGLKSTQEKQQRQAERDQKVAFFEAQKEKLKNVKADKFMCSHKMPFERPKNVVIRWLESIYNKRDKDNPYIRYGS